MRLITFSVSSICAVLLLTQSLIAGSETWSKVEAEDGSLPEARHESAFVAIGDLLVLAGGRGIKPVESFDPKYAQWIRGAKPPFEIHHFQGVDIDGTMWVVGAFTGGYPDEVPVQKVMIYDPEGARWAEGPSIPENR
ncbi:hypothetical protein [uncultured Shewanella sp.]|uniref:hypothetical protein n=1 Tax=uncultured Shewanella sp. TaxID=173975 RepID=UPI002614D8D2|nr:hypothetical protein [uncultured Shewanella sp.]